MAGAPLATAVRALLDMIPLPEVTTVLALATFAISVALRRPVLDSTRRERFEPLW